MIKKKGRENVKKLIPYFLAVVLAAGCMTFTASAAYTDVPSNDVLAPEVEKATQYGLMNGYGNGIFGFRDSMTRAQFVTVLGRMFAWEAADEETVTAAMKTADVPNVYLEAIRAAVRENVIDADRSFRPNDAITRGEMAEMLVRAIGLKGAAEQMEKTADIPFSDVAEGKGYITVAYDIGMTKGTSATTFSPDATATRAQAAAMLLRIYEKLNGDEEPWLHAFYAISSYSQLDFAQKAEAVTLGWSRMTWDGDSPLLLTTAKNGNEYYIPSGYEDVADTLKDAGVKTHLGVYMDQGTAELLADEDGRMQAVDAIIKEVSVTYKALKRNPYNGVTIDFEGLRAAQKDDFTVFLQLLSDQLRSIDQTLYVCVSPVLATGAYFDGYDYRAIGELADKVILMAYDYDATDLSAFIGTEYYKTAAPAPIDQVYLALRAIVDPETGVSDPKKVVLGCSSKSTAWKIDEKGKLLSARPIYPGNETVYMRMQQEDAEQQWSFAYGVPYLVYHTEKGENYFLWYENDRSIQKKADISKLFGVSSVSFWRLGIIPNAPDWNWNFT